MSLVAVGVLIDVKTSRIFRQPTQARRVVNPRDAEAEVYAQRASV
jgi:hypothetical protein